jgi:hypothetical protein
MECGRVLDIVAATAVVDELPTEGIAAALPHLAAVAGLLRDGAVAELHAAASAAVAVERHMAAVVAEVPTAAAATAAVVVDIASA